MLDHIVQQAIDSLEPDEVEGHRSEVSCRAQLLVGVDLLDVFISPMGDLERQPSIDLDETDTDPKILLVVRFELCTGSIENELHVTTLEKFLNPQ